MGLAVAGRREPTCFLAWTTLHCDGSPPSVSPRTPLPGGSWSAEMKPEGHAVRDALHRSSPWLGTLSTRSWQRSGLRGSTPHLHAVTRTDAVIRFRRCSGRLLPRVSAVMAAAGRPRAARTRPGAVTTGWPAAVAFGIRRRPATQLSRYASRHGRIFRSTGGQRRGGLRAGSTTVAQCAQLLPGSSGHVSRAILRCTS